MTQTLNVVVIGRVRDEFKLDDVDDLKKAIKSLYSGIVSLIY